MSEIVKVRIQMDFGARAEVLDPDGFKLRQAYGERYGR
jgi:hypothetical protein